LTAPKFGITFFEILMNETAFFVEIRHDAGHTSGHNFIRIINVSRLETQFSAASGIAAQNAVGDFPIVTFDFLFHFYCFTICVFDVAHVAMIAIADNDMILYVVDATRRYFESVDTSVLYDVTTVGEFQDFFHTIIAFTASDVLWIYYEIHRLPTPKSFG
jgi:hypothetical protein